MTAYVACVWVCLVVVVVLQQQVAGFTLTNAVTRRRCSTLFMGRAAAVRAATKAKTDGAKAKNNARFAKKIIMAVKAGGADPDKNRALGQVIADAKVANVPKDVVTRNIEKASAAATADFKSSVFEFYGHGGCGLIVNVLTDNDNRAAADVNLVAKKQLLKNAAMNSVLFKFDTKARLNLQKAIEEDQLMEVCLEVRACVRACVPCPSFATVFTVLTFPLPPPTAPPPHRQAGVDDYELRTEVDGNPLGPPEEGQASIYVDVKDMAALRDALRAAGYDLETSLASVPKVHASTPCFRPGHWLRHPLNAHCSFLPRRAPVPYFSPAVRRAWWTWATRTSTRTWRRLTPSSPSTTSTRSSTT